MLGIDFVFESGVKKIGEQLESIESLDVKMGVLIGFLGALIAGLLAAFLASDADNLARYLSGRAIKVALVASAALLALALYFAFQAVSYAKVIFGGSFSRAGRVGERGG